MTSLEGGGTIDVFSVSFSWFFRPRVTCLARAGEGFCIFVARLALRGRVGVSRWNFSSNAMYIHGCFGTMAEFGAKSS